MRVKFCVCVVCVCVCVCVYCCVCYVTIYCVAGSRRKGVGRFFLIEIQVFVLSTMIFRLGGFDYIKVAPGDVRLRPCVADYLGYSSRGILPSSLWSKYREHARITRWAQDGSVHMQRSLPSSSYPARPTLNKLALSQHK